MLYIDADHLKDGLYNIKDGEIFKYKAKGGSVRTYKMGVIVKCKSCKHYQSGWCYWRDTETRAGDYCSCGEREYDE